MYFAIMNVIQNFQNIRYEALEIFYAFFIIRNGGNWKQVTMKRRMRFKKITKDGLLNCFSV